MKRNTWVKSIRSGSEGQCVEVMDTGDKVFVRDSKNPEGPALEFGPAQWGRFVADVIDGEFAL